MTRISFSFVLAIFLSCQDGPTKQQALEQVDLVRDIVDKGITLDTSRQVEGEVFYQFIPVTDSTSRIKWGNKEISNISEEVIDNYFLTGDKRLNFQYANSKFIFFGRWRYSDTWCNIILPLKIGEDLRFYQNLMAVEKNRGFVVYEYPDEDSILIAENILTKKQQVIGSGWAKCGSAFYHYCIDSISINNEMLYVEWILPNKVDKPNRKEIKRIKLNL
jgi:hypothetical protein